MSASISMQQHEDLTSASAPWLFSETTQDVLSALDGNTGSISARCVGGCVRNTLMGVPVYDIDIATTHTPVQAIERIKKAGMRVYETGLKHGTITALHNNTHFEITTLRQDVKTDGRHAEVKFTSDWSADAARRDFYMNAVYVDRTGRLFDPTQQGLKDIAQKHLRFVGDADRRIKEDYLRILRFFRFMARLPSLPDPISLLACQQNMRGLEGISGERIWTELRKMFAGPHLAHSLDLAAEAGLFDYCLPGFDALACKTLLQYELAAARPADPLLRLYSGCVAINGFDPDWFQKRLKISAKQYTRFENLLKFHLMPEVSWKEIAYYYGKQTAEDVLFCRATLNGFAQTTHELKLLNAFNLPQFPIRGQDLLKMGLEGPSLGREYRMLEKRWVTSGFELDKTKLLKFLMNNK